MDPLRALAAQPHANRSSNRRTVEVRRSFLFGSASYGGPGDRANVLYLSQEAGDHVRLLANQGVKLSDVMLEVGEMTFNVC
jgi:hypothetical protein